MNVFYTHSDPLRCANEHCTVHTRKMIIEYAQMMSTAHRVLDGDAFADEHGFYKKTHVNHPSAKWVRESDQNYAWLFYVFVNLCVNYREATGKEHKTYRLAKKLATIPDNMPMGTSVTDPPMAMPDEYKTSDTTQSYRAYVNSKYADWLSRARPIKVEWYTHKPTWAEYES